MLDYFVFLNKLNLFFSENSISFINLIIKDYSLLDILSAFMIYEIIIKIKNKKIY